MKTLPLLRLALVLVLAAQSLPAQTPTAAEMDETPAQKDARMKWWREARFGLFIHWGLYAVPAGTWKDQRIPGIGEWIQLRAKIPVAEYARFADQFNPVKFDADAWVALAKEAGMKYVVITSKHHDGFALFKSDASSFNIVDATPFKRDVIAEIAQACRKHGLRLGLYYSQAQDWHHPGGSARGGHWDPAQDGDMTEYIKNVAVPQVREILTKYGPIAVLWWDTPYDMNKERADLLAPLLKLQPGIITNNRLGGGYMGDTETPENKVPATGYPRDWEACMTMNDTWGFKSYDDNWKSPERIVRFLVDIASKGGNYLLNVGPTAEGEIPQPSIERLRAVGAWMRKNSESIYGTSASPFKGLTWGRATQKPDKLYLNVFDWPNDRTLIVPMRGTARRAYMLDSPNDSLKFSAAPEGLRVTVPASAPDPISSVIVLEGVGKVDPLPPPPIRANNDGSFALQCDAADLFGPELRVEGNTSLNLGAWKDTAAYPQWQVQIDRPGTYEVIVHAAVAAGEGGSDFSVAVGNERIAGRTEATGGSYRDLKVGSISIPQAGATAITIKPITIVGPELMKLRTLFLKPVTSP